MISAFASPQGMTQAGEGQVIELGWTARGNEETSIVDTTTHDFWITSG